jgi:hypothetical protein
MCHNPMDLHVLLQGYLDLFYGYLLFGIHVFLSLFSDILHLCSTLQIPRIGAKVKLLCSKLIFLFTYKENMMNNFHIHFNIPKQQKL